MSVVAVVLASCTGTKTSDKEPLTFSQYEVDTSFFSEDYGIAAMQLSFAIPEGGGEQQATVIKALRAIIAGSEIAANVAQPEGETLQEVADNFVTAFCEGMEEGGLETLCEYDLMIIPQYQNEQVVAFSVIDDIVGNGGAMEYFRVLRLSDGHFLERNEMTTLQDKDIPKLAKKFATTNVQDMIRDMGLEGFWIAPDSAGCKMKVLAGSHFFYDFIVPIKDIARYLTDDAKTLFGLSDEDIAASQEEEETPEAYEPGRGDLGGYDLRGPVKEVRFARRVATFNEEGQLMTENGKSLNRLFPGGVKRNQDGRLTECNADAYGSRYYTYNDRGLPTEIAEDGYNSTFTYDADGYIATETNTDFADMDDGSEPIRNTYTYVILEKDSYGNWTKRKDQNGHVTERTILYYEY